MKSYVFALALAFCVCIQPSPSQCAGAFYVAPDGGAGGDGSPANPWDLQTALSHPAAVSPGSTIWLRGGTYRGVFTSNLTGSAAAPIIVRQYPGERAVIDGPADAPGGAILTINGAWTWYWGFEVIISDPARTVSRATGLNVFGPNTRFINLTVHDTGQGYGFWTPAVNAEIYGNLIYNNGFDGTDRGHGHGIYAQNQTGTKRITDNIIFNQFSHGIHVYTQGGAIDNFDISGNISINNGVTSKVSGPIRNILVGGGKVATNIRVNGNYTYFPLTSPGDNNFGYAAGCNHMVAQNNYLAGAASLVLVKCQDLTMSDNTLVGATWGFSAADYPNNRYFRGAPPSSFAAVLPNRYEANRAHIVVYNWDRKQSVKVDVTALSISQGDCYEINNAQNVAAERVSGTYDGNSIILPMDSWTVASPIGYGPQSSTLPEFGAFILTFTTPQPGQACGGAAARVVRMPKRR